MKHYGAEPGPSWAQEHNAAIDGPKGFEIPILLALRAIRSYRSFHEQEYGSDISEDYVLGPELAELAQGLRGLLNGQTGRLDCGTIDGYLCELIKSCGGEV